MKVLFLQDVPGTADAGEVKEVKNGYARNYLIPKKLAAPATHDHLQRIKAIKQAAEEQRRKEGAELQTVADRIQGSTIVIEARVGPTGRLYGAITSRRIAEELSRLAEQTLDHRGVLLAQAIHEPGTYPITLRLHRDVSAEVSLLVVPEGQRPSEVPVEAPVEGETTEEPSSQAQAEGQPPAEAVVSADVAPEAVEEEPPQPEATAPAEPFAEAGAVSEAVEEESPQPEASTPAEPFVEAEAMSEAVEEESPQPEATAPAEVTGAITDEEETPSEIAVEAQEEEEEKQE